MVGLQLQGSSGGTFQLKFPPEIHGPLISISISGPERFDQLYSAFPGNRGFLSGSNPGTDTLIYHEYPLDVELQNVYFFSDGSPIDENRIRINSPYLPPENLSEVARWSFI